MICQPYDSLKTKAQGLVKMIGGVTGLNFALDLLDGNSKVGGGALPLLELPTRLLCLVPNKLSPHYMEEWLRFYDPPIIVRVEKDQVLLDVRTIQDNELRTVAEAVKELSITS
jgi:L-seryl-tRNA(Ser) seleniumtransferase